MSFNWERIGSFATAIEAEQWCDRHHVDRRDRDIQSDRGGFELLVRRGTSDDLSPDGARWQQHQAK